MRNIAIIASLLLFAACSKRESEEAPDTAPTSPPPPAAEQSPELPAPQPALAGTAWRAGESTLEFLEDGKVAGNGGCNRYGGPVGIKGSSIRFGALISTKMACAALEQEDRYFKALEAARSYRMDGGTLVLLDEKGVERVRLNNEDSGPSAAASTAFVNKVWAVKQSSSVAPGTLYVFL